MDADPIHFYPNKDIKVFDKHQVSDHLYTLLLSVVLIKFRKFGINYIWLGGPNFYEDEN